MKKIIALTIMMAFLGLACADGSLPGLQQQKKTDDNKPSETLSVPTLSTNHTETIRNILKKCPSFYECNKNKLDSLRHLDPDEITIEEDDEDYDDDGDSAYINNKIPQQLMEGSLLINQGLL